MRNTEARKHHISGNYYDEKRRMDLEKSLWHMFLNGRSVCVDNALIAYEVTSFFFPVARCVV